MVTKKPIDLTQKPVPGIVGDYKKGVAERAAAQRAARPPMPNLAQANELYKPGKDAPTTIAAIGQAAQSMERGGEAQGQPGALRPETVAGLQALHDAMEKKRNEKPMTDQNPGPPMPPSPTPAAPAAASPTPTTKPVTTPDAERNKKLGDTLNELDDLEFDRVLRSIQTDAINNEKEREAVKKRVTPIDVIRGIGEGVFRQEVPVIPGTLTVWYRSITALENQTIRLLLFKQIDEDKRRENLAAEIYGLMQTVCSVERINGAALPSHMRGEGYQAQFDEDAFLMKFNQFVRYPVVLLHALGTHGYWFEQRVREAFTVDQVKNG
jgi:hypothetical protein